LIESVKENDILTKILSLEIFVRIVFAFTLSIIAGVSACVQYKRPETPLSAITSRQFMLRYLKLTRHLLPQACIFDYHVDRD
jgi:hypothetical protein